MSHSTSRAEESPLVAWEVEVLRAEVEKQRCSQPQLPPEGEMASTAKRQREQVEDSMEAFWQYQAKKTKTNKKLQKLDHRENVKLKEELAKLRSQNAHLLAVMQEEFDSLYNMMEQLSNDLKADTMLLWRNTQLELDRDKSLPGATGMDGQQDQSSIWRSSRQESERQSQGRGRRGKGSAGGDLNKKILTYQLTDNKRIELTSDDLDSLLPGVYLNDRIIDFYLTYLWYKCISLESHKKIRIFSCLFHKRLIDSFWDRKGLSTPERVHDCVKTRTRLFDKDFIVLPVCDRAHWYVLVIVYPGRYSPEAISEGTGSCEGAAAEKGKEGMGHFKKEGKDQLPSVDGNQQTETIHPCIIVLDSLGVKRTGIIRRIRNYLTAEWKAKKPDLPPKDFDGMKPFYPSDNFFDGGVFLLEYVESLLTSVDEGKPFPSSPQEWADYTETRRKRATIRDLIERLMKMQTLPTK